MVWNNFLFLLLSLLFTNVVYAASILNDFDAGYSVETMTNGGEGVFNNTTNSGYENDRGACWMYESDRTDGTDPQSGSIVLNNCVEDHCLKVNIEAASCYPNCEDGDTEVGLGTGIGNYYLYNYSAFDSKPILGQAADADYLIIYIKLPSNYPMANHYTLHIGTYVKDSSSPDYDSGPHYYHWFNIDGSSYWTKLKVSQHPQHQTGITEPPDNNPESYDYMSHMYRFYIDGKPQSPIGNYSVYFDEIEFKTLTEEDDEENICSLSCTYYGGGEYRLSWHSSTPASSDSGTYTIRYSLSPITNSNFSSATLISSAVSEDTNGYGGFFTHKFTIPDIDKHVYFAIDDNDSGSYVTKIDYNVFGANYSKMQGNITSVGVTIQ